MLNLDLLFLPGLDWLSYCNYILFKKEKDTSTTTTSTSLTLFLFVS